MCERPAETFDRLLRTLHRLVGATEEAGDDAARELVATVERPLCGTGSRRALHQVDNGVDVAVENLSTELDTLANGSSGLPRRRRSGRAIARASQESKA